MNCLLRTISTSILTQKVLEISMEESGFQGCGTRACSLIFTFSIEFTESFLLLTPLCLINVQAVINNKG